jgi:diadenosine tetraphosphate (Ap4A) HIT family hydrolase
MTNPTARKFGWPATLIAEYGHWLVLLRPAQATLGALVVACKDEASAFSAISPQACTELASVTADVEATLGKFNPYARINWLMLMMVDRDVHFHVLPRYDAPQSFAGHAFPDPGWPGPPELSRAVTLDPETSGKLTATLKALWPKRDRG